MGGGEVLEAEVRRSESPEESAAAAGHARGARRRRRVGRGRGPLAPCSAWPSCSTPRPPTWRGCRPSTSTTAPCARPSATTGPCGPTTPRPSCAPCSTAASTCRALRLDTAIAAYLLDPAENRYALGELLERYTPHSMATDDAAAGQLDLGGSAVDDAQRAARAALAVNRLAPAVEAALEAQGMRRLYDEIENPLVRVLARMEHAGLGRRRRRAAPAPPAAHRGLQAAAGGGAPRRGPVVQPQLDAAAAPDPVRRAQA